MWQFLLPSYLFLLAISFLFNKRRGKLAKRIHYALFYIPYAMVMFFYATTVFFLYLLNQFITSRLFFHQKKVEDFPVGEENRISSILTPVDLLFQFDEKHFITADGIFKLKGKFSIKDFKSSLINDFAFAKHSNGRLLYPKLTQVVRERALFATWEYFPNFSIDNHVTEKWLDFSVSGEIHYFISAMHSNRMPRDLPGFQFYVIRDTNSKESSDETETIIFFRLDHTMGDGLTFVRIFMNNLGKPMSEEDKTKLDEMFAKYAKSQYVLSVGRLLLLAVLSPIYLIDFFETEPNSYFKRPAIGKKFLAHSPPLDFNKVAVIKKKTNTTVNDVMIMLLGQAFQAYLLEMGESPDSFDRISVLQAISLKINLSDSMSNNFVGIRIKIPFEILDWREQLKEIHADLLALKFSLVPLFSTYLFASLGYFPAWYRRYSQIVTLNRIVTGGITNIPGPDVRMTLAGVPIDQFVVFMPQFADISISSGFITFRKKLSLSISTDQALTTNPEQIIEHFIRKLDDIYEQVSETS